MMKAQVEVKGRVEDKKVEVKQRAIGAVRDVRTKVTGAPPVQQAAERPWIPAAAVAALLVLLVLRRRRS